MAMSIFNHKGHKGFHKGHKALQDIIAFVSFVKTFVSFVVKENRGLNVSMES